MFSNFLPKYTPSEGEEEELQVFARRNLCRKNLHALRKKPFKFDFDFCVNRQFSVTICNNSYNF